MATWHFEGRVPRIAPTSFVHPAAHVIGDVDLDEEASVWFGAVLRGDVCWIRVGARSNIQDNAVVHVSSKGLGTEIGADVTVGHSAVLHACTIGAACLVGIGAIVLDGAVIGEQSMIAAGSLVAPGKVFPPRSLVMGRPANVVRPLRSDEIEGIFASAVRYTALAQQYRMMGDHRI